jgi:hypothetical protein
LAVGLAAIYIFGGAYHFLLYLMQKNNRYNAFYSLFSIALGIYFLSRTTVIYGIIPNTAILHRLETGALYLVLPALAAFFDTLIRKQVHLVAKAYGGFCLALIITQTLFPMPFRDDTVLVWQILALFSTFYIFGYQVIYFFVQETRKLAALYKTWTPLKVYEKAVLETTLGNLVVCTSILLVTGIFDILNAMLFHYDVLASSYGFFIYTVGISFILARKFRDLYNTVIELQNAILKTMAGLVEYRDDVTGKHIERTTRWVSILAEALRKNPRYYADTKDWDIDLLLQSSQLHDVGKIGIADSILKKAGPLTNEEFIEMQKHTTFGVTVIEQIEASASNSEFMRYAKIFVGTHHEKWDGTGYPSGLKGEEIPLQGRIMAIADVYDALTSARPYKEAFSHEEAVKIIVEQKETHFDPNLVDIFMEEAEKFRALGQMD